LVVRKFDRCVFSFLVKTYKLYIFVQVMVRTMESQRIEAARAVGPVIFPTMGETLEAQ